MPKHTISAAASGLPSSTRASRRKPNYDAFLTAVLDPLPDQELNSTQYKALLRRDRREAWYRAKARTSFCRAEEEFYCAKYTYHRWIDANDVLAQAAERLRLTALAKWREAVANQILTPACHRADLAWKRSAAKIEHIPIRPEEIEAAIAADEAFFDAHPVNRRRPDEAAGRAGDGR